MGSWSWVGMTIGKNSLKTFCRATRQFSISAVSSSDITAITGWHTIPKWRWRRCKIVQKWPCGAEWRPLGSSAHIFCVTPWMMNAVFRCWKITYGLSYLAGKISMNLFSCMMSHRHTLHWAYLPCWIRSFWDDEDLSNGLQEVQIPRPVTFSCGAGQRRRCTGQNLAQWNNWRTGFGTLSPASHMTSYRRLWIPSPVVWGSWWMPPVLTLNFKLCVHIPI